MKKMLIVVLLSIVYMMHNVTVESIKLGSEIGKRNAKIEAIATELSR